MKVGKEPDKGDEAREGKEGGGYDKDILHMYMKLSE